MLRARHRSLVLCGTLAIAASCAQALPRDAPMAPSPPAPPARALRLLLTTDEHGWLQPLVDAPAGVRRGGVLAVWDRLTRVEGYAPTAEKRAEGYLLLSSGDMWTGPYESTVLEGAPMVAAMNAMGYAAASIGNHEFDFGTRVIAERGRAARFPFLAANLVEVGTGEAPAWVKPFTIVEAGGFRVGVLGFTNVDSPVTSDPRHMTGLQFVAYEVALEKWAPRAQAAGAEEIVVLLHDGFEAVAPLVPLFRKHGIHAVAIGHHHHGTTIVDDNGTFGAEDDVLICNSGSFLRSYCRIDLVFTGETLASHGIKITAVEQPIAEPPPAPDPVLSKIVSEAEASAQQIGGEVLIENVALLKRGRDGPLGQLVVRAWLDAVPYAQVAITNAGGLRQDLAAGPVRVRDVVSVLPFNNYLLVVDLTGAQLRTVLESDESIATGVTFAVAQRGGKRTVGDIKDAAGKVIAPEQHVKVVINDFMYRGGDRYQFAAYDREPEETAIDWREPVLRKLREMGKAGQKLEAPR